MLRTASHWPMLAVRGAIPKLRGLAKAEFATAPGRNFGRHFNVRYGTQSYIYYL